jgi:hypothetical protein
MGLRRLMLGAVAAVLVVLVAPLTVGSRPYATTCSPKVSAAAIRYCGAATATLSIFKGVTFRGGTCLLKGGGLSLKIGTRSLKNPFQTGGNNSGLPYFDLSVSGPLSSPVGGGVIAFWKGKPWSGSGVSFKGNAHAGTFVAQGIAARGSHGTATGTYRC